MANKGIEYKNSGQRARGHIAHYHGKPAPRMLNFTPFKDDVAGLKPVQLRSSIVPSLREYYSRYTIGVEVEKNMFHRDAVKEYPLFCGFETDSSCGYEAVTNVLPLLPAGSWRTKVYDLFYQAEQIIDDRFSPSDTRCSAHVTITVRGMSAEDFRAAIKPHMGIIMALWRGRLKNRYCSSNLTMLPNGTPNSQMFNYESDHFMFAHLKSFYDGSQGIEFRVPSRIQSVKQMMRRYELFYEVVNFAIQNPRGTHEALMRIVRPIILSMYAGNTEKAEETIRLAAFFRRFVTTGKVNWEVAPFVDPNRRHWSKWERAARVMYAEAHGLPESSIGND